LRVLADGRIAELRNRDEASPSKSFETDPLLKRCSARSNRKRTCAAHKLMSALGQKRHLLTNSITSSTRKSSRRQILLGQFVMNSSCGPPGV